jgi:calpain-5
MTVSFFYRFNGCYEYLDGGNLSEALQDFSGGICETLEINESFSEHRDKNKYDHLYEVIKKAFERKSLMACAINVRSENEMEQKLSCGLVKGHA